MKLNPIYNYQLQFIPENYYEKAWILNFCLNSESLKEFFLAIKGREQPIYWYELKELHEMENIEIESIVELTI